MASKKMNASVGYFNKEMQAMLKKGEKAASKKPASKSSSKKK